jgi:hypothetical protein
VDGSILSAPFDAQATLTIPEPRQTEPPPTEVLRSEEEIKQAIPPTIASPQLRQKPEESASTIVAPAPAFESPKVKASHAQPARKSSRSPLIMIAVVLLLIIGVIFLRGFIIANRSGSTTGNMAKRDGDANNVSNSNQASIKPTTSSPSPTSALNLEGTAWKVLRNGRYEEFFDFQPNGRFINRQEVHVQRGTWRKQGDKVSMEIAESAGYYGMRIEGTIQGEEMSGYFDFLGRQENQSFTARRIK